MKKLLFITMLSISYMGFSQIEIIEKQKTELIGEYHVFGALFMRCEKIGKKYHFLYRQGNIPYTRYESFSIPENDFDDFYHAVKNIIENQKEATITSGDFFITVLPLKKGFGLRVSEGNGRASSTGYLKIKSLDKIFGKN